MNDTDLKLAYNALTAKATLYGLLFNYYDGRQPLVYSTERLRAAFQSLDARFNENWCRVVVDSELNRIGLESWAVGDDETLSAALSDLMTETGLVHDLDDTHLAALVTGESFVVAWPDETTGRPTAFYNDPRLCHVWYDALNPRAKRFAAKWWAGDDGLQYLTLYYPDRLEYYASDKVATEVTSHKAFVPMTPPTAPNPYGIVPVFHFRLEKRVNKGLLVDVLPMQDAINKLFADMMVTAEYGAYPQRYVISIAGVQGKLRNAPNEVWDVPAGDGMGQQTSVGEFSAASLTTYLEAMRDLAQTIGIVTATPAHYFTATSAPPSGDALMVMEAPLTSKVQRHINQRFYPVWQEVGAFLLLLDGVTVGAQDVTPVFRDVASIQPRAQAEIRQFSVNAGIPLVTVLSDEGWTPAEIDQMTQDKEAEQATATAGLGQALLAQQRQFDQGMGQGGKQ